MWCMNMLLLAYHKCSTYFYLSELFILSLWRGLYIAHVKEMFLKIWFTVVQVFSPFPTPPNIMIFLKWVFASVLYYILFIWLFLLEPKVLGRIHFIIHQIISIISLHTTLYIFNQNSNLAFRFLSQEAEHFVSSPLFSSLGWNSRTTYFFLSL